MRKTVLLHLPSPLLSVILIFTSYSNSHSPSASSSPLPPLSQRAGSLNLPIGESGTVSAAMVFGSLLDMLYVAHAQTPGNGGALSGGDGGGLVDGDV